MPGAPSDLVLWVYAYDTNPSPNPEPQQKGCAESSYFLISEVSCVMSFDVT